MKKNQLFKSIPPLDFVHKLLDIYGLKDFDDTRFFSRKNLVQNDTVKKLEGLVPELENYYIKCKAKRYLTELNEKKTITVLRQILKEYGHKIKSQEKYIEGSKILLYQIDSIKKDEPESSIIHF